MKSIERSCNPVRGHDVHHEARHLLNELTQCIDLAVDSVLHDNYIERVDSTKWRTRHVGVGTRIRRCYIC